MKLKSTLAITDVRECPVGRRIRRLSIALLFISALLLTGSAKAGEKIIPPKEPFKVTKCAGRMPLRLPSPGEPPKTAYFIGSVELVQGKITLHADAVVAWISSVTVDLPDGQENRVMITEFYAEGNVAVQDNVDHLEADRMYYNVVEDRGLLENARMKSTRMNVARYRTGRVFDEFDEPPDLGPRASIPLYFRAEVLRLKGKGAVEGINAGFSPCSFGEPHWGVTSNAASVSPAGTIDASGNVFNLWWLPIPLPPMRVEEDFQPPLKRIRYMYSNTWGHTFLSEWNIYTRKNYGIGFILDYYRQAGQAWGADIFYGSKRLKDQPFYGTFEYYTLVDHSGYVTPSGDERRYRLHMTHRQELPRGFRLEAELFKLSDADFLPNFLPREYYANREQESWMLLKKCDQNRAVSFFFKENLNEFFNQSEYTPEASLYDFSEHLGGGIYLDLKMSAGYAGMAFSCESMTDFRGGRFDLSETFSRPVDAGPYLTITPFISGRYTSWENVYYSGLAGPADRVMFDAGISASTELSNVYDWKSEWLKIDKVRHVIRPRVSWSKNLFFSAAEDAAPRLDEIEDAVPEDKVTLSLENIFQKKGKDSRGKDRISDLARLRLEIPFYPENNINDPGEYFGPGEADLELAFGDYAALDFNGDYDPGRRMFDAVSVGALFKYPPCVSLYAGERWDLDAKQTATVQVKLSPSVRWDFLYACTMDLFSNEMRSQAFWMARHFHMWALEFGYEVNYDTSERVFSVYFSPAGLFKSKPSVFRRAGGVFDPRL
jgi:hypothetical protein